MCLFQWGEPGGRAESAGAEVLEGEGLLVLPRCLRCSQMPPSLTTLLVKGRCSDSPVSHVLERRAVNG